MAVTKYAIISKGGIVAEKSCAIARLTFTSLHRRSVAFPSPNCMLLVLQRFASATSMWHNVLLVLPPLLLVAGLGLLAPGSGIKRGAARQ